MAREKVLDPSSSPKAAFGDALRKFRKAKNRTQGEVGEETSYSIVAVSDVERGVRLPPLKFAIRCDEYLETGGVLEAMWWQAKHSAQKEGFPEFAALEGTAVVLRHFTIGVVTGLLQTEEYATAVEAPDVRRGKITEAQAAERVAFRLARQNLFNRAPAPTVHVVLDESCLRRNIGGASVMARQLRHLEIMARRPNVVLQVAPFAMEERPPFTKPVTLLTLTGRSVVGYSESYQRGYVERDPDTVAEWGEDYDRLLVDALSRADSLALIRAVRKELVNMTDVPNLNGASWQKSSYSEQGGECVEIVPGLSGLVPVRDSKDPGGPALRFSGDAFSAFLAAVKAGAWRPSGG